MSPQTQHILSKLASGSIASRKWSLAMKTSALIYQPTITAQTVSIHKSPEFRLSKRLTMSASIKTGKGASQVDEDFAVTDSALWSR